VRGYYILDAEGNPQPVVDTMEWARWYEKAGIDGRRVQVTEVFPGISVSTVFLSLDHGFNGVPALFETMVFGGPMDKWCDRTSTRIQAVALHDQTVMRVREAGDQR
jgi:hypothetical protein